MNFSLMKTTALLPQKEKRLSTFLIALFTAACLFVPYIIMSEGYFTFYGDFNAQQIPFYIHCHEMIKSGKFFWDFGTDLGSNFIGSYSFYLLGSPFFWLTIPFPSAFVPYLIAPLLILKFALCALTAYLYIRRFTRTPAAAQIGALLYAFSGFSIYNIFLSRYVMRGLPKTHLPLTNVSLFYNISGNNTTQHCAQNHKPDFLQLAQ